MALLWACLELLGDSLERGWVAIALLWACLELLGASLELLGAIP